MAWVVQIVIFGGGSAGLLLAAKLDGRLEKAGNTRDLKQQQNTRNYGLSYYPVVMCGPERSVRSKSLMELRTPY